VTTKVTIKEALAWARIELAQSCERPLFEAELIMAYHLKKERIYLAINEYKELEDIKEFEKLIQRRASNEPYEYITNKVSFYDIELYVEHGVLIPRPETEILIDEVSKIIIENNIQSIAEIGVGSGAISIVLARKFPNLKITATDISANALAIAEKNINFFNLEHKITLVQTNLLDEISEDFELIVSNPPYIANDVLLESNVQDYEPHNALFGGAIGDELLKDIITVAKQKNVKFLACEMGYDQKESMELFLTNSGVQLHHFYDDLAGLNRGFVASFNAPRVP
jgi:release factor glutamine methyltransferase